MCSRSSDEDSEEDDEAEEDEYDEDNERLENEGGHSGRNAQPPGTSVSGVNGSSPRGHSGMSSVRVDQTGEEVPGPLPPDQQHSLEEALLKQMEMQKKLHEQLEVGFTSTCEAISDIVEHWGLALMLHWQAPFRGTWQCNGFACPSVCTIALQP